MSPRQYLRLRKTFVELCDLTNQKQQLRLEQLKEHDPELAEELHQLLAEDRHPLPIEPILERLGDYLQCKHDMTQAN